MGTAKTSTYVLVIYSRPSLSGDLEFKDYRFAQKGPDQTTYFVQFDLGHRCSACNKGPSFMLQYMCDFPVCYISQMLQSDMNVRK